MVVEELTTRGYSLAHHLKRSVRRKSKHQAAEDHVITVPNTRNRQVKLMGTRQGGEWFHATSGGAPLNCDDAIMALEMEHIAEQKKKMNKYKKGTTVCQKEIDKATAVVSSKGEHYNSKAKMDQRRTKHIPNWTLIDLKAMIKWKAPRRPNIPTNREGLVAVWNEVKDLAPLRLEQQQEWSHHDQEELTKFEKNGRYCIEQTYIMRRAEERKKETLCTQLSSIQVSSALKVMGRVLQGFSEENRQELFSNWQAYTLNDDHSQSTVSSVGEIELHGSSTGTCGEVVLPDSSSN